MATEVQETNGKGDARGRKSKRTRHLVVKVIERQGKAVLVEWIDKDQYKRATVPGNKLDGDRCAADVLAQGVAYGVDWETVLSEFPGADVIANELRRQGIWTREDFNRNVTQVRGIINRLFVIPLIAEMQAAIGG